MIVLAAGIGRLFGQENKEGKPDSGEVGVFLAECLDFIGGFGLDPEPDEKILNAALDLLIEALPGKPRDAKPAIMGRNRKEALFLFLGALDQLAMRPGQRLDRKALAEKAIGLYVETIDAYSRYRTPREMEVFERALESPDSGIGMEIQEEPGRLICFPFPDSSAEAAGIPLGGRLLTVDGNSVEGRSLFELAGLIRGPEGSSVSLRIEHAFGRSKIHKVQRESLHTPMLLVDQALGNRVVVRIRKINEACLDELKKFAKDGNGEYSTITLDLRSCSGGDLDSAVNIADVFLPEGAPIGAAIGPKVHQEFKASTPRQLHSRNLVLLYNKGTASAAEFLAGALMSNRDALRVSMQGEGSTYGKAVAQENRRLSSGGLLQLTTARLFLPAGTTWQDKGLTPASFESK